MLCAQLNQLLSVLSEGETVARQMTSEDMKEKGLDSKFLPNMVRKNVVFKGSLISDLTLIEQRNTHTAVHCPQRVHRVH